MKVLNDHYKAMYFHQTINCMVNDIFRGFMHIIYNLVQIRKRCLSLTTCTTFISSLLLFNHNVLYKRWAILSYFPQCFRQRYLLANESSCWYCIYITKGMIEELILVIAWLYSEYIILWRAIYIGVHIVF